MEIIVKELPKENHVYLFDNLMRPLSVDVVPKQKTKNHVKSMIKKHNITDIKVVNRIDFSGSDNYIIDRI